jgi:hypothetical protein
LLKRGHDVELFLVGTCNTPYRKSVLDKLTAELGLSERVVMTGFVLEPYGLMSTCDVIVVTSRSEASGRAAIEALLLERALIVTRAGGLIEYILEGEAALSYVPADVNELVSRIETLIIDRDFAETLAAHGKKYALSRFTKAGYGGQIYTELLRAATNHTNGAEPSIAEVLLASSSQAMHAKLVSADEKIAELNRSIESSRQSISDVRHLIAQQNEEVSRFHQALNSITSGMSWKLTSPFRAISKLLRESIRPTCGVPDLTTAHWTSTDKR